MKALALALGFLMFSTTTFADVFEIEKDAKTYRCEETDDTGGSSAATCAAKAYSGSFNKEESIQLCAGARSNAPAECAQKAYSGSFNKTEALQLCKGARTIGPADCAQQAYSGSFNKEEALKLCQRSGNRARAKCAQEAYSGAYNKEEAIKMCAGPHPHLVLRSLELLASSPDMKMKMATLKQKTLQANQN